MAIAEAAWLTRTSADRAVRCALITAAIGLEAWRAWRVSRVARREGAAPVELPDTVWNRVLLRLEHRGPIVLYLLTAIYAVAL